MQLPFTTEQFLELFGKYNESIFPMQILFYILAFFILHYYLKNRTDFSRYFTLILSSFWLWTGIVYHIMYFARINSAAYLFGAIFIVQGGLFIYFALTRNGLTFKYQNNLYTLTGWIMIAYGLFVYPILGYLMGHQYPNAPILSAPCPTVIFTFGVLLFVSNKLPKSLLIIPVLWALIGFSAAAKLTMVEDYGLFISGILTLILIIFRNRTKKLKTIAG